MIALLFEIEPRNELERILKAGATPFNPRLFKKIQYFHLSIYVGRLLPVRQIGQTGPSTSDEDSQYLFKGNTPPAFNTIPYAMPACIGVAQLISKWQLYALKYGIAFNQLQRLYDATSLYRCPATDVRIRPQV